LHARVLLEVADGGLVPWMYGIGPDGERDDGRGIVETWELLSGAERNDLPERSVPLADLGSGAWLLVDTKDGRVLATDASGIVETEHTLESWLRDWANGRNVVAEAFDQTQAVHHIGMNPFTKSPRIFRSRGPLKGRRLSSRSRESG
jgi:hypothetical protein